MDQEYFICGLSKWCFITKIMEKYTIQLSLSRIIFKRDVRVYRTNMNRPFQSLYYVESNTFNILRLLQIFNRRIVDKIQDLLIFLSSLRGLEFFSQETYILVKTVRLIQSLAYPKSKVFPLCWLLK